MGPLVSVLSLKFIMMYFVVKGTGALGVDVRLIDLENSNNKSLFECIHFPSFTTGT